MPAETRARGISARLDAPEIRLLVVAFSAAAAEEPDWRSLAPGAAVAKLGADRWQVCAAPADKDLAGRLRIALQGGFAVLDVTDAHRVLHLEGPDVQAVLSRLCRYDPAGPACVTTEMAGVAVQLRRTPGGVDVLLPRSFAGSLIEAVAHAAAPFGWHLAETDPQSVSATDPAAGSF